MVGFIDAGGGMKGVYTSGVYDYLMDEGIVPDYAIGVSAGAANLITYVAGQRGRTYRFYLNYAFEKEYMSLKCFLKYGSFINLDYIYSGISNSTGKDPLSFEGISKSSCEFYAVATDAETGEPHFFKKSDFHNDDYSVLKASCAVPVVCRPVEINGKVYYDGGISHPIPYEKAFNDGCDKVAVILTTPLEKMKKTAPQMIYTLLRKYPQTACAISKMSVKYNEAVARLKELEKQGKAIIIAPADTYGINTLARNAHGLDLLYRQGYKDAERIKKFMCKIT